MFALSISKLGIPNHSIAFVIHLVATLIWIPACGQPETVQTQGDPSFRITPVKPLEELRSEALESTPPNESGDFLKPDLVELSTLDPAIQFDIRYATDNNFLGVPFYKYPRAYLQRPAAQALLNVHHELRDKDLGLLIYDAYRPWFVTKMFWDATPARYKDYVANPENGSRHNRGAAVDLTLYDLKTGKPLVMPSGYDEFLEKAHPDYSGGTPEQRENRDLLREVMESHGFTVYPYEWWHFDFQGWEQYPILNLTFSELEE